MATYTKETALYDTGAIANDIGEAGETASKYITAVDQNGIKVHAENNINANYTLINAEGMEVFQGDTVADSVSLAKFGTVTRIGTAEDSNITVTESGITGVGFGGKEFFNFSNSDDVMNTSIGVRLFYGKGQDAPTSSGNRLSYELPSNTASGSSIILTLYGSSGIICSITFTEGVSATKSDSSTISGVQYVLYATYDGATQLSNIYLGSNITERIGNYGIGISYTKSDLAPSFELGGNVSATGGYSYAEGYDVSVTGKCSHGEGNHTIVNASWAHAEGSSNSILNSANYSHVEGVNNVVYGVLGGHAEGYRNTVRGSYSHAEGQKNITKGAYSHVGGKYNLASEECQTVIGKYNSATRTGSGTTKDPYEYSDAGNYAFIIGNGEGDATEDRSNALTVDWNGNIKSAGAITDGNGNSIPTRAYFYTNSVTATTISSTSTPTKVPITGISAASGFEYDSTNKGIKCTEAGTYMISVQQPFNPATSGDLIGLSIYKNGVQTIGIVYTRIGGNYDTAYILPTIIVLAEGDYLTLYAQNNTASRGQTQTATRFSAWKVD